MKQPVTVFGAAIVLTMLMAACGTENRNTTAASNTSTATPQGTGKKVTADEIHSVLVQHDKALNEKNLDAVMATFSSDPNTVVLGTGAEEKWVGPQEIRTAYTEMFKDYDPGTLQANCDWKTGNADDTGTMAWLAAICAAKDSMNGKVRQYKLNVSATVAKQNDKWRFVMLHMSNAFQPPVTK